MLRYRGFFLMNVFLEAWWLKLSRILFHRCRDVPQRRKWRGGDQKIFSGLKRSIQHFFKVGKGRKNRSMGPAYSSHRTTRLEKDSFRRLKMEFHEFHIQSSSLTSICSQYDQRLFEILLLPSRPILIFVLLHDKSFFSISY